MIIFSNLLRLFFQLLYHQFSWSYDLVAAIVSLGRWKTWVCTVIPYLQGRVLELGPGPGHLQSALRERGFSVYGLDESTQMLKLIFKRLQNRHQPILITRGLAQEIPFSNQNFDTVVTTFPSEYIFDPLSLASILRILNPRGKLVILMSAWITGGSLPDRLAGWLFRVTGQVQGEPGSLPANIQKLFRQGGFVLGRKIIDCKGSKVMLLIATKRNEPGTAA